MVGMGTMVGSGTGAAMTAVAMVFEMTRDYDIVLPMVLAVAVGLGVRRLLSRENIYTMKLVRRGHPIPKALHANMFLVRSAADVMDRDFLLVDENQSFARELSKLGRGENLVLHLDARRAPVRAVEKQQDQFPFSLRTGLGLSEVVEPRELRSP